MRDMNNIVNPELGRQNNKTTKNYSDSCVKNVIDI